MPFEQDWFYFYDNFRRITQWVSAFTVVAGHRMQIVCGLYERLLTSEHRNSQLNHSVS